MDFKKVRFCKDRESRPEIRALRIRSQPEGSSTMSLSRTESSFEGFKLLKCTCELRHPV
jgi:hypothetical protein